MAKTASKTEQTLQVVSGESTAPVKRGRGRPKGHAPSNPKGSPLFGEGYIGPPDQKEQLISKCVKQTLRTYLMPRVRNDEELEQRLAEYFQHCADTGERPTVEQLYQCTGWPLNTVSDWEYGKNKGFTSDTALIIKKAKAFLRVFDAKMVAEGALNPVVYIFRAKNYYGMKDQQDVVLSPSSPFGSEPDEKQLAADYLKALPE